MHAHLPAAESIFCAAIDIEAAEARAAYVEQACAADAPLRQQVDMLLAAHFGGGSFLDTPALWTTMPAPPPAECAGTLIGPYKLLEQIGEGGMGIVYMAEQQQPVRRRVALKIIKPGMDTRHVIARFEAERQALALMEHPNIARVLDAGTTESGRPYFVMELVRGIAITDYCDQAKLSIPERLKLFITVCRAVQHAHQKGIIHRDLKPSNILVTLHDGTSVPKVIDFGIAKATGQKLTEHTLVTGFAHLMGTPAYMSPEQTEPAGQDIDTRSDIYSLGVLLYELLTGHTPFDRKTLRKEGLDAFRRMVREVEPLVPSSRISTLAGDALTTVADCRASEPRKLGHLIRGELDWLVMKALEKDRNRRYETASALAADVERHLNHEPVQACPPSTAYRLRKFIRRNKGPVAAATLVLFALAAGITSTTIGLMRARTAEGLALTHLDAANRANTQTTQALKDTQDATNKMEIALNASETARTHAQAAEKKAADEAAIAQAVSNFLIKDLFEQADVFNQPADLSESGGRDSDVTVRTLLNRAAKTIDGKFRGQPLIEATIRHTIGETYHRMGLYAEARTHLERSLALRIPTLGADHADTLQSKLALAALQYSGLNEFDAAEVLVNEVLEARRAKRGDLDSDTLRTKDRLAHIYLCQGKLDIAESFCKQLIEEETAALGSDHEWTVSTKYNLAMVYCARKKYELGLPLLKESVDQMIAALGQDHLQVLYCKLTLAQGYADHGNYVQAETLYKEVLETPMVRRGPDLHVAISCKFQLAIFYKSQSKAELAELLLKEILTSRAAKLRPDNPDIQGSLAHLSNIYAQRQPEVAERLYKELIDTQCDTLGTDHPGTLSTKIAMAAFYLSQGKHDQAEALYKKLLETRGGKAGTQYAEASMHALALLYQAQGKYELAETQHKELIELRTSKWGESHPNTLDTKRQYAAMHHSRKNYDQAESLYKEVINGRSASPDTPAILASKQALAELYREQGKHELALALYKGIIESQHRAAQEHPEDNSRWAALNSEYAVFGELLRHLQRNDEAEDAFRKGLAIAEKLTTPVPTAAYYWHQYRDSLGRLTALLKATGRTGEAEESERSAMTKYRLAESRYKELVDTQEAKLGSRDLATLESEGILAMIYRAQGKTELAASLDAAQGNHELAEPLWRELLDLRQRRLGPQHLEVAVTQYTLGLALLHQKKFIEAERLFRECLAVREKGQPDRWTTFDTQSMLGASLFGQKRYADAEPLLLAGYEALLKHEAKIPASDKTHVIEALLRLVELYDVWGEPDEAANKGVDSRRVTYLDDLEETTLAVWAHASLGKHGEFGVTDNTGKRLKVVFQGSPVAHALGMHVPSDGPAYVVYELGGRYSTFYAKAALLTFDESFEARDSTAASPITFKVVCDGKLRWQSKPLQRLGTSQACVVNIQGVKTLRLEAHHSGSHGSAYAAWLRPMVTKIPLTEPSTSAGSNGSPAEEPRMPLEAPPVSTKR